MTQMQFFEKFVSSNGENTPKTSFGRFKRAYGTFEFQPKQRDLLKVQIPFSIEKNQEKSKKVDQICIDVWSFAIFQSAHQFKDFRILIPFKVFRWHFAVGKAILFP